MADRVHPVNFDKKGKSPSPERDDMGKEDSKEPYYRMKDLPQGGDKYGQPYAYRPPPQSSATIPESFVLDGGYDGRPRKKRSRKRSCCLCMACFCGVITLILFLLGLAVLIFWLVVRPKIPKYNVEQIRLTSFAVDVAQSGFVINAGTAYTVNVENPNTKIGIYYDHINIDVSAENSTIGHGTVASFYQGHKNTTIIIGEINAVNYPVGPAVGAALQQAQTSGKISLQVDVHLKVRIKIGVWKSPRVKVGVHCDVGVNPNIGTGTQVVKNSQKCKFKR